MAMNSSLFPLKNKKVLLVGLGLLKGGLSTALWLLKQKPQLTITDLKTEKELTPTLNRLKKYQKSIKLVLGKHRKKDFYKNDLIVLNPAINTFNNPYIEIARKKNIPVENELTLFLKYLKYKKIFSYIIGITGTRGKTTTSLWLYHFLSKKFPTLIGLNNPDSPLLFQTPKIKNNFYIVLEIPSFHLELVNNFNPKIAIITNLYRDHLDRYLKFKNYLKTKAKIFITQSPNNYLILNNNNSWTKNFLNYKPKSQVFFFSLKPLPLNKNGIFLKNNYLYFQNKKEIKELFNVKQFINKWGIHNLENLMASLLSSYLLGIDFHSLKILIKSLPQPPFRQQEIFSNKYVKIINDSAATTPEATISAIKRFSYYKNLILITGGTDKNLQFKELAKIIVKNIPSSNLILLKDTATLKIIKEFPKLKYQNFYLCDSLKECLTQAKSLIKKSNKNLILFSPASKSFNKFKNEYHRGKIFNQLVKEIFS